MTDSDSMPEEIVERMLVKRVAYDLVRHDRYDTHGEAIRDSKNLIELHRQGRDELPSFSVTRLYRLEQRFESVTGESIGDGLELYREELADAGHSLRVLCPWLL